MKSSCNQPANPYWPEAAALQFVTDVKCHACLVLMRGSYKPPNTHWPEGEEKLTRGSTDKLQFITDVKFQACHACLIAG